ncbi:MAG: prephenate dehydratase [Deltaproteobacteria bacterium]|nr:prephenate dehydratase [Deltaproteobacteria bacterium]
MTSLEDLRRKIDSIDEALLKGLNERASIARRIGELKSRENRNFHAPSREKAVLERIGKLNPGPLSNEALEAIYREIMSASLALEEPVKVAYLGPEGTFSHLACLKNYGSSACLIPVRSFSEVFDEVERGRVHYGVVPIENSIEGVVNNALDNFMRSELKITSEILLPISHSLLSLSGEMEKVRKVYSFPQPTAQCRRWIEQHIPHLPIIDMESTAGAAQRASEDPEAAAIAGDAAARHYGLKVIEKRIEDNTDNVTRFLTIAKEPAQPTGDDKTSVVFAFRNEPGALFRFLQPFAEEGINLTKIESRPSGQKAWEYVFFVDLEGHEQDPPIRKALDRLGKDAFFLKVLGSYPRARA